MGGQTYNEDMPRMQQEKSLVTKTEQAAIDSRKCFFDGLASVVELYSKAGMDVACYQGCPVNW